MTVCRGGAQCHQLHDRLDGLQKPDENLTKIRDWLRGHSEPHNRPLFNWAFYNGSLWGLRDLWSCCRIPLLVKSQDFSLRVFTLFTFCLHNRLQYSKRLPEEAEVCVQLSPDSHNYHVSPFTTTQSLFHLLLLWLQTFWFPELKLILAVIPIVGDRHTKICVREKITSRDFSVWISCRWWVQGLA